MTVLPTTAAAVTNYLMEPTAAPLAFDRPPLREGAADVEMTLSATLLEEFLRDPLNEILQPDERDGHAFAHPLFFIACGGAGITVKGIIAALLYDHLEGVFYPSRECIAGVVIACAWLSGKPVRPEQVFAQYKIDLALAADEPLPIGSRSAHNVRQVFGDGCPAECRFCNEVVLFEANRHSGNKGTRITVPESDFRYVSDVLKLSTRALNALRNAGVETIFHLRQADKRFLLSIRSMGRKTFDEIVAEAGRVGIEIGSLPNPTGEMLPIVRLRPLPPRKRVN